MNVLLIGSGGREHALAWKIAQSPLLTRLVVAPGNPGVAAVCETRTIGVTDVEGLISLAQEIAADLVVVGPEAALEVGRRRRSKPPRLSLRLSPRATACRRLSTLPLKMRAKLSLRWINSFCPM
jgi:hypothetical protein